VRSPAHQPVAARNPSPHVAFHPQRAREYAPCRCRESSEIPMRQKSTFPACSKNRASRLRLCPTHAPHRSNEPFSSEKSGKLLGRTSALATPHDPLDLDRLCRSLRPARSSLPAISCLGASRTPPVGARGWGRVDILSPVRDLQACAGASPMTPFSAANCVLLASAIGHLCRPCRGTGDDWQVPLSKCGTASSQTAAAPRSSVGSRRAFTDGNRTKTRRRGTTHGHGNH
jgi:hypothetical protein